MMEQIHQKDFLERKKRIMMTIPISPRRIRTSTLLRTVENLLTGSLKLKNKKI